MWKGGKNYMEKKITISIYRDYKNGFNQDERTGIKSRVKGRSKMGGNRNR